jgi:hypothetical protein
MLRIFYAFFVTIFFLPPVLFCAEVPKPMLENVANFAEAGAILDICHKSSTFKTLTNEKALNIFKLMTSLSQLVEKIGNHYYDDNLLLVYELTKAKLVSDDDFQRTTIAQYEPCCDNMVNDMTLYISKNESIITTFFSKAK